MSKRSVFFLAMLAALGLLWSASAQAGCINAWITSTTTVQPGTQITVPVQISDVAQGVHQIYSYDLVVSYCGAGGDILSFVGVNDTGTVAADAGWMSPLANESPDGTITIAAAGSEPLVGQGILVNLVFDVSSGAQPCDVCDVDLISLNFNQPDQNNETCLDGGQVYVQGYDFTGRITVAGTNGTDAMEGVKVRFYGSCGEAEYQRASWTDADGHFFFTCLPECLDGNETDNLVVSYPYVAAGDGAASNGGITPLDATRVLQHVVGIAPIADSPEFCSSGHSAAWLAAETSGDGTVGSYDAALILRFLVGDIGHLPAFDGSDWVFCNGTSLGGTGTPGDDFEGLLIGDVTRYTPVSSKMAALSGNADLTLTAEKLENDLTQVSIMMSSDVDVYGGQIVLDVGPGVELVTSDALQSALVAAHQDAHTVRVAFAGASGLAHEGGIVTLSFRGSADASSFDLTSAKLNEGAVNATLGGEPSVDTPTSTRLKLLGNYPNPFNPSTKISFYVPSKTATSVAIFDVSGRKIRTLASNQMMEGEVSMIWNGMNDQNQPVASGTYFYQVKAGDQIASKSMVLVK